MLRVDEALAIVCQAARPLTTRRTPLQAALEQPGMVLAESISADRDYPPFDRAMMDGFAIRSADYRAGAREFSVVCDVAAGDPQTPFPAETGTCARIMTGAPVPHGGDCVIQLELAENLDGRPFEATSRVRFDLEPESIQPWRSVARRGEELAAGTVALPAGLRLTPPVATTLAALGVQHVPTLKLPRPCLISTGTELVEPGQVAPLPHQIRDSNSHTLWRMFAGCGIAPVATHVVRDDRAQMRQAIEQGLDAELLVLTGGVSMGAHDYVPEVLTELEVELCFHKVAIKPGKPFWFGRRGDTPVFALPGNPVASLVAFKVFIEPWLDACVARSIARSSLAAPVFSRDLWLPLAHERKKKDAREHYFPVRLVNEPGQASQLEAASMTGSGDIRAGLQSDGLAVHPADRMHLGAGSTVRFMPW